MPNEVLGPTLIDVANKGATPANPSDILSYYFKSLESRNPLNEARLILVGHGDVGKTSIVERLVRNRFKPQSKTEGINITKWGLRMHDSEDISLNIWDFGGQEIMHSTHQFFLTHRSLYVLVLSGRAGHEDDDANYWLRIIESFGEDSPVVVVLNKMDEHRFDLNRGALRQKYPFIREFVETDCKSGVGIPLLKEVIERETDRLPHLRDAFPADWFGIKDHLSRERKDFITYEEYRKICKRHGEPHPSTQDALARYLHSLGVALNYKDDPRLRDTHVLNPHWVTEGIYKIINARHLAEKKGELELSQLSTILDGKRYPAERHHFLLELMRKFELCFKFPEHEQRYLIPELLGKQQPAEAEAFVPEECLHFEYQYPIPPAGILPRFIVRTHVLSSEEGRWRTGVILQFEGNRALVKADLQDKKISVYVSGPQNGRRRLLAVIRLDFERIYVNLTYRPEERVPVPGHPDVSIPYRELLVMEEEGVREYPQVIEGKVHRLDVQALLNGVDLEGSRRETRLEDRRDERLRLFFSYSHKDELLRDELEVHLKILERQKLIAPWHDRRIPPGEDWGDEIDANLERADIVMLLVSADFIASNYCYEKEMKRALERHKKGEARVIPIILRPCMWESAEFGKLQGLPREVKPVTEWENKDQAWKNVAEGIQRVIRELGETRNY